MGGWVCSFWDRCSCRCRRCSIFGDSFFGNAAINTVSFSSGFAAGVAGGVAGGFIGSAGYAWYNGSNFWDGLGSGMQSAIFGSVIGGITGGIYSGIRANKMGLDFWNGDEIIDADMFNSLVATNGDIACTDCNFSQGEKLSEFRADLTGSNSSLELAKAYKKAHYYTSYLRKKIKVGDLINYNIKWKAFYENGWKNMNYSYYMKDYFHKGLSESMRAVIPTHSHKNYLIKDVFMELTGMGQVVKLIDNNSFIVPISKIIFYDRNSILANRFWEFITNY